MVEHSRGPRVLPLLFLAACWSEPQSTEDVVAPVALDPNNCPAVANATEVRADYLALLFPSSANDTAFLCGLNVGAGSCPSPHEHLDGVISPPPGVPLPTRQQRMASANLLGTCDR